MTISPFERAGAALHEAVHRQWRDWTRYLEAHLVLLDARTAERQVAFERDETLEEQANQAHTTLAALPPAQRALFEQLHEERRQAVQAAQEAEPGRTKPPDPDVVDRQALQALRDEATGGGDPNGWGIVPLREGARVTWYEVNVAALQAAPTAATYALGSAEGGSMRTRLILAGLLVGGGILFLLVWFLWPRTARRTVTMDPLVVANGAALAPWPLRQVIVEGGDHAPATLPVSTTPPASSDSPPAAIWVPTHLVPLRLCLPADVLADAEQITLVSGEGRPDRVYILTSTLDHPDLRLDPCSGRAASRTAMFQQLAAPDDAAVGVAQTLADETTATLAAITLIGPGDDPSLPIGQARVVVQVQAAITDWAAYAPTLLLADGQARLPAEAPRTIGNRTELHYLVPLPTTTLAVAWSLTPPETAQPRRWRATLPVPPDRASVMRAALAVSTVAPAFHDGTLTLTITLRNRRKQPILLRPDDIVLTRSSGTDALALTAPTPVAFAEPLAGGVTRTLVLMVALNDEPADPLILVVGAQRFRIRRDS